MNELRNEIAFGLETLDKIHSAILSISQQEIEEHAKTAALAYECMGYYNAIEQLIIRIFKHLKIDIPSGQFYHRDILTTFFRLLTAREAGAEEEILKCIENLMAFRHVATKIYGFLIDWDKLEVIVSDITERHDPIRRLFWAVVKSIETNQV
jgi:hypothetical protein